MFEENVSEKLFPENFNAEGSIKKWAKTILIAGIVFMVLCVLAAIVLLGVEAEDLWWIALIVLADGLLTLFGASFLSTMVWGFGDVVGNTKRIASGTTAADQNIEAELPEL